MSFTLLADTFLHTRPVPAGCCDLSLDSYGLYSYGLYSYGLDSDGLYSYGLYHYGLDRYGLYNYGLDSYGLDSYGLDSYGLHSYGLDTYGLDSYGLYSYGLYSYDLHSYGIYSYGLYSYGLYSYGLYSYGLYSYGLQDAAIGAVLFPLFCVLLWRVSGRLPRAGAYRDVHHRRPMRAGRRRQRNFLVLLQSADRAGTCSDSNGIISCYALIFIRLARLQRSARTVAPASRSVRTTAGSSVQPPHPCPQLPAPFDRLDAQCGAVLERQHVDAR